MRVVQVGIGGMGNAWLKAVQATPEVEYAALVEISPKIIAQQVKAYGLDKKVIFPTLEEALDAVEVDGVINVTPPAFHRPVSFTALEAGKPVLSEKPLADTLDAARDIVQKADETGVLHMVTQDYRYKLPLQTIKSQLDSGRFGAISAIDVAFSKGPYLMGFHQELQNPLLNDMSIHHFDLLRFFLGQDPQAVYARTWNPPWSWFKNDASASVTFEFPEVVATYRGTWVGTSWQTTWEGNWTLTCENGVIALVDDQVYVYDRGELVTEPSGFQQYYPAERRKVRKVRRARARQVYLLYEFYQAVMQGKAPVTTCQDNIRSLEMVFGAIRSAETGQPVGLPLTC